MERKQVLIGDDGDSFAQSFSLEEVERHARGWTLRECARCESVQPFLVETILRRDMVGALEWLGDCFTCDFCDTSYDLPKKEDDLAIDCNWDRSMPIERLAETTNPEHDVTANSSRPTDTQLVAALCSMQEKGSMGRVNALTGIFVGGIVASILGAGIGALAYMFGITIQHIDMFGQVFLYALVGLPLGSVIGGVICYRIQAQSLRRKALHAFMAKHGVPIQELVRAGKMSSVRIGRILKICEAEQMKQN